MMHHRNCSNDIIRRITSEKGDGTSVVVFGVVAMLLFIFTAVNMLNGKIIEEKYNVLKDAVESAAAGSVIHMMLDTNTGSNTETQQKTLANYDLYLQLALGYSINDLGTSGANVVTTGETNNYLKLDHAKCITSTLELIGKSVLGQNENYIIGKQGYAVHMFFIEPFYNIYDGYKQGFQVIAYSSNRFTEKNYEDKKYEGEIIFATDASSNDSDETLMNQCQQVEQAISIYATNASMGATTYEINLGHDSNDAPELVRDLIRAPHYMVLVTDFALPTLYDGVTTLEAREENFFKSAFTINDGRLKTPICTMQSGKVERKLKD